MGDPAWKVVGGSKEGILVRQGQSIKSEEAGSRLQKGAVVRELELQGERLHYELLKGTGPKTGWVSLRQKGADLLVSDGQAPPRPKEVKWGRSIFAASAAAKGSVIWLFSFGAWDKVHSFVALGMGLRQAGYAVRLFAEKRWEAVSAVCGLEFVEAGISSADCISQGASPDWVYHMRISHFLNAMLAEMEAAPPDLVLHDMHATSLALLVGKRLGVCIVPVWHQVPHPNVLPELWGLDMIIEHLTGSTPFAEQETAVDMNSNMMGATTRLELEAVEEANQHQLAFARCYSGYWYLPEQTELELFASSAFGPQADLQAFTKAGPKPVYVCWCARDGLKAIWMVVQALKECNLRAVIQNGEDGLNEAQLEHCGDDAEGLQKYAATNIFFAPAVPTEWLLPRCSFAMLTGSSGATGACLRAALPMLVTPADGNGGYYGDWIQKLEVGWKTTDLESLDYGELLECLKELPKDATIAERIAECQKQLQEDLGVPGAVMAVNTTMKNEVLSGATKRQWLDARREAEEAAETDEEPLDGVLRPPPEEDKKPVTKKAQPPLELDWLKPDGKGKVLIVTMPLKGHIVHLIRIARWFLEHPGYEVTVVCAEGSVNDIPKGATILTYKDTGMFKIVDEGLAQKANLEDEEEQPPQVPSGNLTEEIGGDMGEEFIEMMKAIVAPIVDLKPNIFVTDETFKHFPMPDFIPAMCKVYKIANLFVVSPSLKQNRIRQIKAESKLRKSKEEKQERSAQPVKQEEKQEEKEEWREDWHEEQQQEQQEQQEEKEMQEGQGNQEEEQGSKFQFMGENGMPDLPWRPKSMSQLKLNQVLGTIPTIRAEPSTMIFPSSSVLHAADCYDHEIFTGPFPPLPKPVDGVVQHGREELKSLGTDYLGWLFESEDPVVYVAFGTIVSRFLTRAFVKRLVEGLLDGNWRVMLVMPPHLQSYLPPGLAGPRWRIEAFAPQGEILRCERTRCFISHCGANGTMEAMCCGVPMVCMPFYMDQFDWAWTVRRRCRAGVQVSCHSEAPAIRAAVSEVLTVPSYRENAHAMALKMAAQSDNIMAGLGSAMTPKATDLGPGVSVVAAVMIGMMKGQDIRPIRKLVV